MTGAPATLNLPLLPIKNVVLFPHMIVPLYVGRERSIAALDAAMAHGKQVFLCTQRRADCEDPRETDLYRVGVLGDVVQMLRLPDNTIKVLIEGSARAVIERFLETEPHLRVEVAPLDEDIQPTSEQKAASRWIFERSSTCTFTFRKEQYRRMGPPPGSRWRWRSSRRSPSARSAPMSR